MTWMPGLYEHGNPMRLKQRPEWKLELAEDLSGGSPLRANFSFRFLCAHADDRYSAWRVGTTPPRPEDGSPTLSRQPVSALRSMVVAYCCDRENPMIKLLDLPTSG